MLWTNVSFNAFHIQIVFFTRLLLNDIDVSVLRKSYFLKSLDRRMFPARSHLFFDLKFLLVFLTAKCVIVCAFETHKLTVSFKNSELASGYFVYGQKLRVVLYWACLVIDKGVNANSRSKFLRFLETLMLLSI